MSRRLHIQPLNGIWFIAGSRFIEIIVAIGKQRCEFGDQFDANFVTALANGRTNRSKNIGRFASIFLSHSTDSLFRDASERSAPTCVNCGNSAFPGIDQKNRDAIGGLYAEKQILNIGCRSIAENRFFGDGRNAMGEIGMNLLERSEREILRGKRALESLAVCEDVLAFVPFHKTQIENLRSIESALSADSCAESVNEPRNPGERSEPQNFHALLALK